MSFEQLSAEGPGLIDRLTAAAQAARDATDYNAGTLNGKRFVIREDIWAVIERAEAKFNCTEDAVRFQRAVTKGRKELAK